MARRFREQHIRPAPASSFTTSRRIAWCLTACTIGVGCSSTDAPCAITREESFCDCRTSEAGFRIMRRPRGFSNMDIVDEYRRPKMAYQMVKHTFHALQVACWGCGIKTYLRVLCACYLYQKEPGMPGDRTATRADISAVYVGLDGAVEYTLPNVPFDGRQRPFHMVQ